MKRSRPLDRLRERMLTRPIEDEEHAYYTTIADQVTKQRAARELSQRELAGLCGTTQSAIARLERGERPPRIDTLLGVANALDCELLIQLRPRTRARNQR
jgi:transcriptional regulator with XRE-family HTH domain